MQLQRGSFRKMTTTGEALLNQQSLEPQQKLYPTLVLPKLQEAFHLSAFHFLTYLFMAVA